jgi:hypothetical protein
MAELLGRFFARSACCLHASDTPGGGWWHGGHITRARGLLTNPAGCLINGRSSGTGALSVRPLLGFPPSRMAVGAEAPSLLFDEPLARAEPAVARPLLRHSRTRAPPDKAAEAAPDCIGPAELEEHLANAKTAELEAHTSSGLWQAPRPLLRRPVAHDAKGAIQCGAEHGLPGRSPTPVLA